MLTEDSFNHRSHKFDDNFINTTNVPKYYQINNKNMTMSIINPPFLRRGVNSGERRSHCDPAEIKNKNNRSTSKRNRHSKKARASARLRSTCIDKKEVSFLNQVTVIEVERVWKKESGDVWYTVNEMDRFRCEASKEKERRRLGVKRSSNSTGHIRRILLQQRASQELDGQPTDPEYLCMIASDSSEKPRRDALNLAQQLAEEVQSEVYSEFETSLLPSSKSKTSPTSSPLTKRSRVSSQEKSRTVTDFYWGAVFDVFTDVTCGINSTI